MNWTWKATGNVKGTLPISAWNIRGRYTNTTPNLRSFGSWDQNPKAVCDVRGTSIALPVQSPLWKSLKALHHSETAHHGGKRLAWRWCQFSLFRFSRSSVASSREYWPKKKKERKSGCRYKQQKWASGHRLLNPGHRWPKIRIHLIYLFM